MPRGKKPGREPAAAGPGAPPPPLPEGALSYADYLRVDALVGMQERRSRPPHHDEMQFIVVHQVFELWFRLLLHETDRVGAMLDRGDDPALREAVHLLRRVARVVRLLQPQIEILDSMKPLRFLGFRSVLEPASGFQSYQFRELEAAWGRKDPRHLAHHGKSPARAARLRARLEAPSIAERLAALLRRRGLDYPDGADEAAAARRVAALRAVYEAPAVHPLLEDLLELLLEVDGQFNLWRRHHVLMVERMIGRKWGTGGSQGVPYLETTLDARFFPDLWAVRTYLQRGPGSEAPPA